MPIYLNGQKCIGAYKNGQRINGYIQGHMMFNYTKTVTVRLNDPWGDSTTKWQGTNIVSHFQKSTPTNQYQTLYNVPVTVNSISELCNYGLSIPFGYNTSLDDSKWIEPSFDLRYTDNVLIYIYPKIYTITINIINTHKSYKPWEQEAGGSTWVGINYGRSFTPDQIVNNCGNNYSSVGWSEDLAYGNGNSHTVYGDASYTFGVYPNNDF